MNRHETRVSIGMPVFNGEKFLEAAIQSILAQTFSDFELIISDNASTDRTAEICAAYAAKDNRIRYSRNEVNLGAAKNFNSVFDLSSGEYFKWAAVDDLIESEFLAQCVDVLDKDPTVAIAYSRARVLDELYGRGLREGTMRYEEVNLQSPKASARLRQLILAVLPCVYPIFGLIRSELLRQTPLIRPCVGADHCLLVDLVLRGKFAEVPEYLQVHRWHPESYGSKLRHGEGYVQADWYDARNRGRIVLPHWRRVREYFRSIVGCGERFGERIVMFVCLSAAVCGYGAAIIMYSPFRK